MKILVTGASGMIGTKICQQLAAHGHELVLVSRNPGAAKHQASYPGTFLGWDELAGPALGGVEAVVNLAGESIASGFWTKSRRARILESRVDAVKNLASAFRKSGYWPKTWVNASAIGFYGDRGDEVLTEDSPRGTGFLADVCVEWEKALLELPESTRVVRLRISMVLDARGGALAAMLPAFRAGVAGTLGSGKQWMSWIHVDDLTQMFVTAVENDRIRGVYNAAAPEPVTNKEFTKTLSKILKRSALVPVPTFALKLVGEMSSLLLASQKVSSRKISDEGFSFRYGNLQSALENLLDFHSQCGVFELFQEQWVNRTPEELFPFFCDENNLERLTPASLQFKVLNKSTPQIEEGTLINYRLKIRGIPQRWRTKIIQWNPITSFVDTQLIGPYKQWHHTHTFIPLAGGTLMRDRVLYKLPLWPLSFPGLLLVRHEVGSIFKYRRKAVEEIYK